MGGGRFPASGFFGIVSKFSVLQHDHRQPGVKPK
jgi:hypothetical protein